MNNTVEGQHSWSYCRLRCKEGSALISALSTYTCCGDIRLFEFRGKLYRGRCVVNLGQSGILFEDTTCVIDQSALGLRYLLQQGENGLCVIPPGGE